jgi:PTH1 family peptidyl-tRNA hydrolase
VRIGVGHPGNKDLVHAYVLNDFAKSERPWVEALVGIIADNVELLARDADATFQNKVHLAMAASGFGEDNDANNGGEATKANNAKANNAKLNKKTT